MFEGNFIQMITAYSYSSEQSEEFHINVLVPLYEIGNDIKSIFDDICRVINAFNKDNPNAKNIEIHLIIGEGNKIGIMVTDESSYLNK